MFGFETSWSIPILFYMKVSWNRGTPKSSIWIGCPIIYKIIESILGTTIYGTPHIILSYLPNPTSIQP